MEKKKDIFKIPTMYLVKYAVGAMLTLGLLTGPATSQGATFPPDTWLGSDYLHGLNLTDHSQNESPSSSSSSAAVAASISVDESAFTTVGPTTVPNLTPAVSVHSIWFNRTKCSQVMAACKKTLTSEAIKVGDPCRPAQKFVRCIEEDCSEMMGEAETRALKADLVWCNRETHTPVDTDQQLCNRFESSCKSKLISSGPTTDICRSVDTFINCMINKCPYAADFPDLTRVAANKLVKQFGADCECEKALRSCVNASKPIQNVCRKLLLIATGSDTLSYNHCVREICPELAKNPELLEEAFAKSFKHRGTKCTCTLSIHPCLRRFQADVNRTWNICGSADTLISCIQKGCEVLEKNSPRATEKFVHNTLRSEGHFCVTEPKNSHEKQIQDATAGGVSTRMYDKRAVLALAVSIITRSVCAGF